MTDTTNEDPYLVVVTHRPVVLGDAFQARATHEPSRVITVSALRVGIGIAIATVLFYGAAHRRAGAAVSRALCGITEKSA